MTTNAAERKGLMAAVFAGEVEAVHPGPGSFYDTVVKRMADGERAVLIVPACARTCTRDCCRH